MMISFQSLIWRSLLFSSIRSVSGKIHWITIHNLFDTMSSIAVWNWSTIPWYTSFIPNYSMITNQTTWVPASYCWWKSFKFERLPRLDLLRFHTDGAVIYWNVSSETSGTEHNTQYSKMICASLSCCSACLILCWQCLRISHLFGNQGTWLPLVQLIPQWNWWENHNTLFYRRLIC